MSSTKNKTKSHEKMRDKIHDDLLQRQAADTRALDTVMSLLQEEITEEQLIEAARKLNPQYYRDATEERGLALLCGYPICSNKLKSLNHRQKYRITTKSNKVYEISERKYFCSSTCYKASKYLEGQLSEEPLWARSGQHKKNIQLMEASSSSANLSVSDDSVVIDSSSVYMDLKKDPTEEIAEQILRKLIIDESRDPQEGILDDGELSGDDSSDEELLPPAHDLLHARKQQRLNIGTKGLETSPPSVPDQGEDWKGSMLNRTKQAENSLKSQHDLSTEGGLTLSQNQNMDVSNHKTLPSSEDGKGESNVLKPEKLKQRSKFSKERSKFSSERHSNRTTRYDENLWNTTSGAQVILLTNPVLHATSKEQSYGSAAKAKQTHCLEACFERLLDWFTDATTKLLFANTTELVQKSTNEEPDSLKSSSEQTLVNEVEDSGSLESTKVEILPGKPEDLDSDADTPKGDYEVEVTTPHVESTLSTQRSIVYRQILKSYEKFGSIIPDSAVFRDRLSDMIKTFRLNRENVTARPAEWNVITLILNACVHHSDVNTVRLVAEELRMLTGEEQAAASLELFMARQRQMALESS